MTELYLNLEEDGVVSLWIGQQPVATGSNFLRNQYKISYYDPDNQECIVEESLTPIFELVSQLSYSSSFRDAAVDAAKRLGKTSALWIMAQFNYAYDPVAMGVTSAPQEPVFIGRLDWHE